MGKLANSLKQVITVNITTTTSTTATTINEESTPYYNNILIKDILTEIKSTISFAGILENKVQNNRSEFFKCVKAMDTLEVKELNVPGKRSDMTAKCNVFYIGS